MCTTLCCKLSDQCLTIFRLYTSSSKDFLLGKAKAERPWLRLSITLSKSYKNVRVLLLCRFFLNQKSKSHNKFAFDFIMSLCQHTIRKRHASQNCKSVFSSQSIMFCCLNPLKVNLSIQLLPYM